MRCKIKNRKAKLETVKKYFLPSKKYFKKQNKRKNKKT